MYCRLGKQNLGKYLSKYPSSTQYSQVQPTYLNVTASTTTQLCNHIIAIFLRGRDKPRYFNVHT